MKYFIVFAFTLLISSNVFGQSEAVYGDDFWSNLETFRNDLIKGREGDFEKIDSLYWVMASRFRSYTKASHQTSRVILAGVIKEMSYQEYVASVLVEKKHDNIESNLKSEEFDFIVKHHELIDFKRSILIKFRAPFLVDTSRILKELEFYKFDRNEVCADIGTSTGNFGFLMAALDLDLEIYVTDVNRLDYLNRNLDKWNELDYLGEINFREGSEDKLNLPVTCDKIFMRNTLHHIKKYKKILEDVESSLNPGGLLIIEEAIPSESRKKKRDECKKKIEPKKVEKRIKQGGFLITHKEKIGNSIFYKCVPE